MLLLLLFIYINFVFILALSPRKSRIAEADHGFVKTAGPANSREFTGLEQSCQDKKKLNIVHRKIVLWNG